MSQGATWLVEKTANNLTVHKYETGPNRPFAETYVDNTK